MCFSTEASFGAGVILTVMGIATLKKTHSKSQIAFAAIPLIFAAQQFTEGFVWLSLSHINYAFLNDTPAYLFLIIAQVIWPLWIPISIFLFEKEKRRKKVLATFIVVGVVLSLCMIYNLLVYDLKAGIIGEHIHYKLDLPNWMIAIGAVLYFITTVVSPFVSTAKHMKLLGVAIFTSYLVAKLFFDQYVISVWCFLAAIMSIIVYIVIKNSPKEFVNETTRSFKK
jgi:hypothetical protein